MNTKLNSYRRKHQGFTLIELMIAIAIIGILASLAIPAFSSYLVRSRVSEAINYANGCKAGYIDFYTTNSAFPTTNDDANCPTISTDNVSKVSTNSSGIVVALGGKKIPSDIQKYFIGLQPLDAGGKLVTTAGTPIVSWNCVFTTDNTLKTQVTGTPTQYIPTSCRNVPK